MAAPIELRLSPQKSRLVVGEGIVLDLEVRVLTGVDMGTIEMNRNRTTIRVDARSGDGSSQFLTGIDYLRVHKISPLTQIEDLFHADAGAEWTVGVELFNYSAALPAGHYAISLSYRYGDGAADSVSTNTVEIEVVPAELGSAEYRWLGGGTARDVLACIWIASNGDGEQWFFQNADPKDPGAVQFATSIGSPAHRPGARPVLAHLNDIHAMHFEKYGVWEQDGDIGFLKVHRGGASGKPGFARHGLGPGARLIDPPLQQRDGGLRVMLLGTGTNGQPACSVVSVEPSGVARANVLPLKTGAEHGLALWPAEAGAPLVFLHNGGGPVRLLDDGQTGEVVIQQPVEGLVLSQWMGSGTLGGFFRDGDFLRAFTRAVTMDSQGQGIEPKISPNYEMRRLPALPGKFVSGALSQTGGVALLFERDPGLLVLDRGEFFAVSRLQGSKGTPALIPGAGALFLVHHDPKRGFIAELVGAAAPEPLI